MRVLVAAVLLGCMGGAYAQCPAGIPNTPGCIPPDGPGWRHNMPAQQPAPQTAPRPKQWSSRWGAIAVDDSNSSVGTSVQAASKRGAEQEAMAVCGRAGGNGCRIVLAYQNQCGVLAWGYDYYATARGPSVLEASKIAISECSKSTKDCKISYSDCSLPVRAN
ncbi:DUF4189 domain-containing protein [Lysobacter firmicutimachus]|uniref:DUF4189 domain-containing protein n=1 Tax=Lysobacter firmicutimachus TaxID=1792846 RepID=UPI003CE5278F